jgi:hypothetical protein
MREALRGSGAYSRSGGTSFNDLDERERSIARSASAMMLLLSFEICSECSAGKILGPLSINAGENRSTPLA